jgi:hypothetical protein
MKQHLTPAILALGGLTSGQTAGGVLRKRPAISQTTIEEASPRCCEEQFAPKYFSPLSAKSLLRISERAERNDPSIFPWWT